MIITDLKKEYEEQIKKLAWENYLEEREFTPSLPLDVKVPDMKYLFDSNLGVVAIEGNQVIGFISCFSPWEPCFWSNARGTFSPMHGNGAVKENRGKIYQRMVQVAIDKWVKAGISYYGIALYEHDEEAKKALFAYGFGHRCTDAVRDMEPICFDAARNGEPKEKLIYREIDKSEVAKVRDLRKMLSAHLAESPCFMYDTDEEIEEWITMAEGRDTRIFAAMKGEKAIAFMEINDEGENFATEYDRMKNICGTFCLPEYRGQNIYQNLLNYVIKVLKNEGYTTLGVDYESINPTAESFWPKYFTPYTCSVTRRIDDRIFTKYRNV